MYMAYRAQNISFFFNFIFTHQEYIDPPKSTTKNSYRIHKDSHFGKRNCQNILHSDLIPTECNRVYQEPAYLCRETTNCGTCMPPTRVQKHNSATSAYNACVKNRERTHTQAVKELFPHSITMHDAMQAVQFDWTHNSTLM